VYLLNEDDCEVLFDLDEEYHRSGHFTRIFPPKDIDLHKN